MSKDRKITWDELAKNQNNNWFVIDNKVYDPTSYLNDHPGGPAVIQNRGGKDATKQVNDVGHSAKARETMTKYQIGVIDENTVPDPWQQSDPDVITPQQCMLFFGVLIVIGLLVKFVF